MKSGLFQRLALNRNKEEILTLSRQGQEIQNPQDIVKAPFVLEFVDIPEKQVYLEIELKDRLIANLQDFLLELDKGFDFIGRQYLFAAFLCCFGVLSSYSEVFWTHREAWRN